MNIVLHVSRSMLPSLLITVSWANWHLDKFYLSSKDDTLTLRKHAYSNILKNLQPKKVNFQIKILIFFHISAQNIDCVYSLEPPRRGGSNEYPQSMFLQ